MIQNEMGFKIFQSLTFYLLRQMLLLIPLFLQAMVQDFQKALFWLLSANSAVLLNCISESKTQI